MAAADHPRPGRRKDAGKREAILAAAHRLFIDRGFDGVTMDAVAAAAGVSKMTAYSHFADKEALFEAAVRRFSETMTMPDEGAGPETPLEERLFAVGRRYLSLVLHSEICAGRHTLAAALRANPALARKFYDAGPGLAMANVAALLAAAGDELDVPDPLLAAEDLLSLWQGNQADRLAIGLVSSVSPDEIDRRARRGTDVFLQAYRHRHAQASCTRGKSRGL